MLKPTKSLKAILTIFMMWLVPGATAQKTADYESVSTAQGLSQGMVFDILQDKEGFIWVATKNGLNRYDGYNFKVFTNDPYNAHTLSSNTIIKLFEDSKGRIWAGTENAGLNIYHKENGKFYRIVHKLSDPGTLSGNGIRSIVEMPDGRILVAVADAGLNTVELTSDFFEKDAAPVIARLTLPNNTQVYGMGKDKNGNIWIGGMDRSVYRFDPLKNSFNQLNNAAFFNNGYLNSDGSKLINSNLFLSDGKEIYPLFDSSKSPAGNLLFNPREKLWEFHHREQYFYDIAKWEPGKPVKWNEELPADTSRLCYPFIIDRSGILWSGSVGYGLRKYNTTSSKFKAQTPGFSVRFIVPVTSDDVFTGDYAYGWRRLKNDIVETGAFNHIPSVTQIDNFIISKTGDYWIKSDNKGYFKYNPASGKLTHYPQINYYNGEGDKQPMLEDSRGNIWFPGLGGEITRLNTSTERIDSFSINTDATKPMLPKAICTALYEDKQGVIWIGTQEGFAKLIFAQGKNTTPQVKWFYNNSNTRNSLNYNHVSCLMDDPAAPENIYGSAPRVAD
ncbi:MAG: hypothetical protein IPP72_15700 [Chitinophagaceae bacterium]|nr:hypothetical protein [Chitinophagaceae bacterium]